MSSRFKFERGQKLSNIKAIHDDAGTWLKGFHCEVVNRVYDVDIGMEYYVVLEYLETDVQPQGELRMRSASKMEVEYVQWIGYDAWNASHPE